MDLTDVRWQKVSCSNGIGGTSSGLGLWHKASYSGSNGGNCVEVTATCDASVAPHKSGEDMLYLMRDSKDPDGPQLAFTTAEWEAFIAGVKDGEFDLTDLPVNWAARNEPRSRAVAGAGPPQPGIT
jgi:hypothetical protein